MYIFLKRYDIFFVSFICIFILIFTIYFSGLTDMMYINLIPIFMFLLVFIIKKPHILLVILPFTATFLPEIPLFNMGSKTISLNIDIPIIFFAYIIILIVLLKNGVIHLNRIIYSKHILYFIFISIASLLINSFFLPISTIMIGFMYFLQWVLYLSLPFLIKNYINYDNKLLKKILFSLLFSSIIMIIYLFYIKITGNIPISSQSIGYHSGGSISRLRGFWNQGANAVGFYLVIHVSIVSGIFFSIESKKYRIGLLIYIISALYLLLFTYSRSSYLALLISLLVILKRKNISLVILYVFIGILIITFFLPDTVIYRITDNSFYYREIENLNIKLPVGGMALRINRWLELYRIYLKRPLLGHGFGLTRYVSNTIADNTYIDFIINVGIIGFIILLKIGKLIWYKLNHIYEFFKKHDNKLYQGLTLGMIGAFCSFLVFAFFSDMYARWRVLSPFFLYLGIVLSSNKTKSKVRKYDKE